MFLTALPDTAQAAQPNSQRKKQFQQSPLEVRMFNAGEGEAILAVFPGNKVWLIDGGSSNSPARNQTLGHLLVAYLEERSLTLEACVPSHPHVDHVGALTTILASGSQRISPTLTIYRSDDPTWDKDSTWLNQLRAAITALGAGVQTVTLRDAHREVPISDGVRAHFFAGSGDGAYTSIFLQLRFHQARLLFTGDAHCAYEIKLLNKFGAEDFSADVLKVTHHGSSSGTARTTLQAIQPAITIASTAEDSGHRLELDTLERLGGRPGPRAVYETHVDGDIILRTDGAPYAAGILYQIDFETPGRFATDLNATIRPLQDIQRTRSNTPACN